MAKLKEPIVISWLCPICKETYGDFYEAKYCCQEKPESEIAELIKQEPTIICDVKCARCGKEDRLALRLNEEQPESIYFCRKCKEAMRDLTPMPKLEG